METIGITFHFNRKHSQHRRQAAGTGPATRRLGLAFGNSKAEGVLKIFPQVGLLLVGSSDLECWVSIRTYTISTLKV